MKRNRQIDKQTEYQAHRHRLIQMRKKGGYRGVVEEREIDEDRLRKRQRTILFYRISCAAKWKHNLFKSVRHPQRKMKYRLYKTNFGRHASLI